MIQQRPHQVDDSSFADLVAEELATARTQHPKPINSQLEGWAVICEELEEVKDIVMGRVPKAERSPEHLLSELIQVGAMAQRMAEDLRLLAWSDE